MGVTSVPRAATWDERGVAWRGAFGALLFFAMAVGVFINAALSVLAPYVIDDLGFSRARFGTFASMVSLTAALASPVIGVAVDGLGSKRALTAGFCVVAVALTLFATSQSYATMALSVVIAGAALAVGNPATNKLIANLVPAGRQGLYVGIKQSGGQLNWVVAGLFLPFLADAFGWRWSLALGVGLAAGGIVAVRVMLPDEPRAALRSTTATRGGVVGAHTGWLCAYAFFMSAGMAAGNAYLPLYAHEKVGLSKSSAGALVTIAAVISMITRVLWAHRTEQVTAPGKPLAMMSLLSVGATVLLWLAASHGVLVLIAGAILFGASATAWGSLVMLFVLIQAGRQHAGRASGLVLLAGHGGLVATPIIFGRIVDKSQGEYGKAWAAVCVVYLFSAAISALWHLRSRDVAVTRADRV